MKVLNFEDSVYKANAIRKVLNQCGVAKIELVSNVEDGLQMLKNAEDAGAPFDLIITDMHYPMKQGAVSDTEAGEKLVQLLQEQGKQTKVIVCSSRNMKLPGVYGCIWYSERRYSLYLRRCSRSSGIFEYPPHTEQVPRDSHQWSHRCLCRGTLPMS